MIFMMLSWTLVNKQPTLIGWVIWVGHEVR